MNPNRAYYDNLNFVRVFLSILVTWSHCYPLTGAREPISEILPSETGGAIAVKAFFLISGFLVMKSWYRAENAIEFVLARSLRIFPALFIALLFTITLAFASSSVDQNTFFTSARNYFLQNITLFWGVAYELPGAFASQANTSVNGSLWTLPWELRAYFALLILGILGAFKYKILANLILVVLVIVLFGPICERFYDNDEVPFMLFSFILGALLSINFKPAHFLTLSLLFVATGISLIMISEPQFGIIFCIFSIILFFGFTNYIPLFKMESDPSYGIYIFSFPIQQFIVFLFGNINPLFLFFLTLVIVLPISILSWHLVEKKALSIRHVISNHFQSKILKNSVNAILLLSTTAIAWSVFEKTRNLAPVQPQQSVSSDNFLWGVYLPSTKTLSLRKDLSSGYADFQIAIKNDNAVPFVGVWGQTHQVKLGLFDIENCNFTFFESLSTERVFDEYNLPCKATDPQPLLGDWVGDGTLRPGIYFSSIGLVVLMLANDVYQEFYFGSPGAGLQAFAGDWNKDGTQTIGLWDPTNHIFYLTNSNKSSHAEISFRFEEVNAEPIYQGISADLDGETVLGLYDRIGGRFVFLSLETRKPKLHIEYGPKGNASAVPIFMVQPTRDTNGKTRHIQ